MLHVRRCKNQEMGGVLFFNLCMRKLDGMTADAKPLEKLLVLYYTHTAEHRFTTNILLGGQGPMIEGRIDDAPADLCRIVRALRPLIAPPIPFRIGTLATTPALSSADPWIPPKFTCLLVWEGSPVQGGTIEHPELTFEDGSWRKATIEEWAILRTGELPFGIPLPPPGIPFLDLYVFQAHGRRAGVAPQIAQATVAPQIAHATTVATSLDEWRSVLRNLGFSTWQVTRILTPHLNRPDAAFVPYGAELRPGRMGYLHPDTPCPDCKVALGERHAPTCHRKECPTCAGPNLAAGDLCHRCFKRDRRLVPRESWGDKTGYEKPDKLSARCLQWWDRITALGWRPNRRINMMGYYTAAEFYGVWIWEYLHILSPLLCALDGEPGHNGFEGAEFGLALPPPRAKRW